MIQTLKTAAKYGSAALLTVGAAAHAALPTEVTTALSDAKADAKELAIAFLLIVIVIAAIAYLKRAK